jgi:hypothetical protein
MVLYWFFYSLLNQMSSDSPGDPYQKEHKLVDKCIEKQQVHPDVVQPEIIAGSYRPLIFLFIMGWASFHFINSLISFINSCSFTLLSCFRIRLILTPAFEKIESFKLSFFFFSSVS